jgi:hypothetical protein
MQVACANCGVKSDVANKKVPLGRSYFLCPSCGSRINIFKGLQPGALVTNLVGIRFLREGEGFHEEYCEPGELWRVVHVTEPCPDRGDDKDCERKNKGRCPNQRLVVLLERDQTLYRTCLYRNGRRIFDKAARHPVGADYSQGTPDEDTTHRIR